MDRNYTEDDLVHEAARQYAMLAEDPDFMETGERMQGAEINSHMPPVEADGAEGWHWDEALSDEEFAEAQKKVHELIEGAADLSEWAVEMGKDDLEPDFVSFSANGQDKPILRMYFAFGKDVPKEQRRLWRQQIEGLFSLPEEPDRG